MKLNSDKFKPIINYPINKLGPKNTEDVLKCLDEKSEERYKIIKESLRKSIAYGAYHYGKLASYAMAPGARAITLHS